MFLLARPCTPQAILAFTEQVAPGLHYSFGDKTNEQLPHIVGRPAVARTLRSVAVVTRGGETAQSTS